MLLLEIHSIRPSWIDNQMSNYKCPGCQLDIPTSPPCLPLQSIKTKLTWYFGSYLLSLDERSDWAGCTWRPVSADLLGPPPGLSWELRQLNQYQHITVIQYSHQPSPHNKHRLKHYTQLSSSRRKQLSVWPVLQFSVTALLQNNRHHWKHFSWSAFHFQDFQPTSVREVCRWEWDVWQHFCR